MAISLCQLTIGLCLLRPGNEEYETCQILFVDGQTLHLSAIIADIINRFRYIGP